MINYSVIIPHKNCLNLLKRCLDSIPIRSDLEIIVVDDNSDIENVRSKILSLSSNPLLKIVTLKTTYFAGGARNFGLKLATGKWIIFADADDFFSEDAFLIMDEYLNSFFDIVYFSHKAVYSDDLQPAERLGARNKYIHEFKTTHSDKSSDYLKYLNHSPASKMIKHKIIIDNDLKFDEVPASNDAMFSVLTAYYAVSIEVDTRVVYIATIRRGSITQTRNKINDYSRFCVDIRLYDFFRSKKLYHLYPFVTMWVLNSLRYYGFCEFFKYMKLAHKYNINIFLGLTRRFSKRYKY